MAKAYRLNVCAGCGVPGRKVFEYHGTIFCWKCLQGARGVEEYHIQRRVDAIVEAAIAWHESPQRSTIEGLHAAARALLGIA
jgi:uncharacterized Zn finger protein (UPF0148 family)